jgi:hypothetical protein
LRRSLIGIHSARIALLSVLRVLRSGEELCNHEAHAN